MKLDYLFWIVLLFDGIILTNAMKHKYDWDLNFPATESVKPARSPSFKFTNSINEDKQSFQPDPTLNKPLNHHLPIKKRRMEGIPQAVVKEGQDEMQPNYNPNNIKTVKRLKHDLDQRQKDLAKLRYQKHVKKNKTLYGYVRKETILRNQLQNLFDQNKLSPEQKVQFDQILKKHEEKKVKLKERYWKNKKERMSTETAKS